MPALVKSIEECAPAAAGAAGEEDVAHGDRGRNRASRVKGRSGDLVPGTAARIRTVWIRTSQSPGEGHRFASWVGVTCPVRLSDLDRDPGGFFLRDQLQVIGEFAERQRVRSLWKSGQGALAVLAAHQAARGGAWSESSTTPDATGQVGIVRITHPFHPLRDRDFRLVESRWAWGEARVFFEDDEGRVRRLPLCWTSLCAPDPFVVVAAGRSPFRFDDLVRLAALVAELVAEGDGPGAEEGPDGSGKVSAK